MTTQKSDFKIRRAEVADVEILARHRTEMWLTMQDIQPAGYEAMRSQCLSYFRDAVPENAYVGWLVTLKSGEVVAGGGLLLRRIAPFPNPDGSVCLSEKQAHILNMYTEKDYRRHGLARLLMDEMLQWCEEESVGHVTLNASGMGKPLYEKLGFTHVPNFMKWNGRKL